jgi:hypothetical protein
MLLESGYTPNQDTHDYVDDVVANEESGTGYTAGGDTLTTPTCTVSGRVTTFDADDAQWTSSTLTARYAVIYYDDAGGDADSLLIAYVDFGEDKSSEAGTFQITWDASGIFTFTVAA